MRFPCAVVLKDGPPLIQCKLMSPCPDHPHGVCKGGWIDPETDVGISCTRAAGPGGFCDEHTPKGTVTKPLAKALAPYPLDERQQREYMSNVGHAVRSIARLAGRNPDEASLRETPMRVAKAWAERLRGVAQDPRDLFKEFEAENYGEMVSLGPIQFYSTCEHHYLPFWGKAWVAYIPQPKGKIIGVSKLARLVDLYARRLQVQERMTAEIVAALQGSPLKPRGVACLVHGQHMCAMARGVGQPDAVMKTSKLTGVFLRSAKVRSEFYSLCG